MTSIKRFFNGYIPGVVWWAVVLILICTPGRDLPKLGDWTELISLDKIIHVVIFGCMGYFFMRPLAVRENDRKQKMAIFVKVAIAIALWGLCTEFIQKFWVQGRTFDLMDFLADAFGGLLAYFYARKYLLR